MDEEKKSNEKKLEDIEKAAEDKILDGDDDTPKDEGEKELDGMMDDAEDE